MSAAPDHRDNKRGTAGQPPWGRRQEDEPIHQMVYELQQLQSELVALRGHLGSEPKTEPLGIRKIAALVAAGSTIAGAMVGVIVWMGGNVAGPGARFDEYKLEEQRADSVAAVERRAIVRAVSDLDMTVARFGYDVCVAIYKQDQQSCFNGYLNQQRRTSVANPLPSTP